ncbi:MAG TPA: AmmeMemoRadiSam system radical SAM enzyme [Syntrophales bacterium]|nr:AmmeMemoRadiSam system radical SAM enzyme [Syntrophales bacterium]
MISRREFLQTLARLAPVLGGSGLILSEPLLLRTLRDRHEGIAFAGDSADELLREAPRAHYWSPAAKGRVQCHLCFRGCLLAEGQRGQCRSRMNAGGEMKSLVYGRPVSVYVDPIEKKPFYHFLPGSQAYSIGTTGCPLRCKFCQNWQTSQASPEDYRVRFTPPGDIVESVRARKVPVIAYTYNEPLVFTEYMLDIASAARLRGVRSVMVTCGSMAQAALGDMCKALDAVKIDLKGYSETFYRDACDAELKPVLRTIRQIAKSRVHLEIVNLVVPTLNDSDKMLTDLSDWVMGELGPDVPLHFSRFRPDYQMLHLPPTPPATLERARSIAMSRGLRYVYVGNVPGHPGNNTFCPSCKKEVIRRRLFFVEDIHVKGGKCGYCGKPIAGVFA